MKDGWLRLLNPQLFTEFPNFWSTFEEKREFPPVTEENIITYNGESIITFDGEQLNAVIPE